MPRFHYAWVILAVSTLVVFGALGLARFGYTVVLPAMQAGLGMDNAQAGALATANLVGYLTLSVVGGALASRYGPRAVIAVGLALSGAGMLLTGRAQGFDSAAAMRLLTGIGSGASNVPVMGLLAAWFASKRRGLASGIAVSGSSIGLIALGPLVPRLLDTFGAGGWRVSWTVFGGTALGLAVVSALWLRNRPAEIGLAPVGAEGVERRARGAGRQTSLHAPRSTLHALEQVIRLPGVWRLGPVYMAFGFAYIIYMTFFTKCLIAEVGYTKAQAGALFMLMGWFSLACGLLWGAVSDAIGRKYALAMVYAIQAVAIGLFEVWPSDVGLTVSAILFGLTAWSVPAIMAATCGDLLGARLAPAGLGFITVFFGLGQALGPSVAGVMADATGSFFAAYLLAAAIALLGAVGSLLLGTTTSTGALRPVPVTGAER